MPEEPLPVGRRRHAWIHAAMVVLSILFVLAGMEAVLRATAGLRGDWYAAGPARLEFLANAVQRNPDGFRDRPFGRDRRPGSYRVLAVGDSFTFGDGIERVDETWPRVAERRLRAEGIDAEVLNLGKPGANTAFERAILQRWLPELHPDAVVLAFVPNDPEPPGANRDIVRGRIFVHLLPWEHLDDRLTRASYAYAWLRAKENVLLEKTGRKETYAEYVLGLYRPGPTWDAFEEEARGLVADVRAARVRLIVALFPLFHDLERDPWGKALERAGDVFRSAGAEVVDLRSVYAGRPTDTLWIAPTDAHPNALGHRLAGEAIAARLATGPPAAVSSR